MGKIFTTNCPMPMFLHETTTFMVNQVAVIDRITEINYQINSTYHSIIKVVKIVSFNEIT